MYNVATTSGDTLTVKYYDDNDKLLSTRKFLKKEVYSNIKGVSNADLTFEIKDERHKVVFSLSQSNPTTAVNVKNKFGTATLATTSSAAFSTWNDGEGFVNMGTYRKYTALLTQSGTSAPVAKVLENTLGGNIVWTRSGTGAYLGTLVNIFEDPDKLFSITSQTGSGSLYKSNIQYDGEADYLILYTIDSETELQDSLLGKTPIELRLYN